MTGLPLGDVEHGYEPFHGDVQTSSILAPYPVNNFALGAFNLLCQPSL